MPKSTDDKPKNWPEKVTIAWLVQHMPITAWLGLATFVIAAFMTGLKVNDFFAKNSVPETLPRTSANEERISDDANAVASELLNDVEFQATVVPSGLFIHDNPFPPPFHNFPIGTKMSVFLKAFPEARRNGRNLWINFPAGKPFDHASYEFNVDRIDPTSTAASFHVRYMNDSYAELDSAASAEVWQAVLGTFRSYDYVESKVDERIFWDDVNGYELSLSEHVLTVTRR